MHLFETDRLVVRHYTTNDEENFFLLNGDAEVMRYIRPVKTREESNRFLNEVIGYSQVQTSFGRMAVDDKLQGFFVGSFAIIPLDKTPYMQIGYSLLRPYWGKGYASELVKHGLVYAADSAKLSEIYAVTEIQNVNSQHVLTKNGFEFVKTYEEGIKQLNLYFRKLSSNSNL